MLKTAKFIIFLTFIFGTFFNVSPEDASELEADKIIRELDMVFSTYPVPIRSNMKGEVIHIIATKAAKPVVNFTINLKTPEIIVGSPPANLKVDVTFQLDDEDLGNVFKEILDAEDGYKNGQILVQGNLDMAMQIFAGLRWIKKMKEMKYKNV